MLLYWFFLLQWYCKILVLPNLLPLKFALKDILALTIHTALDFVRWLCMAAGLSMPGHNGQACTSHTYM